jgi:hypothetical protein
VPRQLAMFRLLAMPSLDKVPVGRESWLSSPRCSTHGKVTKHDPEDLDVTSLRQWLLGVPASVIDAGLAAAVAVAVVIAIRVSTRPGERPVDVFAYALGLMLAALVLVRRRWPVAVLVASAAILHLYYLLDYPGILPAVPLAVALAGAWAAGHLRWSLLLAAWFVVGPILFRTLAEPEPLARVLNDSVADAALLVPCSCLERRSGPAARCAGSITCCWPSRRNLSGCCSTCCPPRSRPGSRTPTP